MRHISSGAVLIDRPCSEYSGNTTRSMVGRLRRALPTIATMRSVCAASSAGFVTVGNCSCTMPSTTPAGDRLRPPSPLMARELAMPRATRRFPTREGFVTLPWEPGEGSGSGANGDVTVFGLRHLRAALVDETNGLGALQALGILRFTQHPHRIVLVHLSRFDRTDRAGCINRHGLALGRFCRGLEPRPGKNRRPFAGCQAR